MTRIVALLIVLVPAIALADPPVTFAKRPLDAWIADLDDKDALVQEEALEVLTLLGPQAKMAVPKLELLAKNGSEFARRRAATALWKIDGRTDAAIVLHRAALKDATGILRIQTIQKLRELGVSADELAPMLIDSLADADIETRTQTENSLRSMGADALPALVAAIPKARGDQLQRLLFFLSAIGEKRETAMPILQKHLQDPDTAVKMACVRAIMLLDRNNKNALAVLSETAQSTDAAARSEAIQAGLKIQPRSNDLMPIYRAGLKERTSSVRVSAAQALWEMDRNCTKEILPILLDDLKQPSQGTMRQGIGLLGQIGPEAKAAIPLFVEMLRKPEEQVNQYLIISAIGKMGPDGLPILGDLLKDKKSAHRHQVMTALIAYGEAGFAKIQPLLNDEDLVTRQLALTNIGQFGKAAAPAVPQLIELLKGANLAFRYLSALALGQIGPAAKDAVPGLVEYISDTKQPAVYRAAAIDSLGRIGPAAKTAVDPIRECLKDGDPHVRFCAAMAIIAITGEKYDEANAVLLDMLKAKTFNPRYNVEMLVSSLESASVDPKEIIAALVERFKSGNVTPDLTAVLISHFSEEKAAIPLLKDLLANADAQVKFPIAVALAKHGAEGKAVIPILVARAKLDANSVDDPNGVVIALGKMGSNAAEAFDDLMEMWKKPLDLGRKCLISEALVKIDRDKAKPAIAWLEEQVELAKGTSRTFPLFSLTRIDPNNPKCLPATLNLLEQPNPLYTVYAMEMLASQGPSAKDALPRVRAALKERQSQLRIRAAIALWKIDGKPDEALPILTAAVTETDFVEPTPGAVITNATRTAAQIAAWALGEMGEAAKSAVPALREAQNLNDSVLRRNATIAIRKIEKKS